jgi:hypothetical protein
MPGHYTELCQHFLIVVKTGPDKIFTMPFATSCTFNKWIIIQSNLSSRMPQIMNNSAYEQISRTQSVSDDVMCLELWTRKPSASWSDKLGVLSSAVFLEEWSSGKHPESATPIGESVSCSFAFVHSNSLCLLFYFSVLFFYKLLNRTPWGQRKTMIAAS